MHGPTAETDRQRTRDEPRLPTVLCTCLIAPFSGGPRRVRARNDRRTVDLQHLIAGVVQQSIVSDVLASSRIEISVTVVEGHGSMEACAINSAVLAVADAGASSWTTNTMFNVLSCKLRTVITVVAVREMLKHFHFASHSRWYQAMCRFQLPCLLHARQSGLKSVKCVFEMCAHSEREANH